MADSQNVMTSEERHEVLEDVLHVVRTGFWPPRRQQEANVAANIAAIVEKVNKT